jgi:hypothetical protein
LLLAFNAKLVAPSDGLSVRPSKSKGIAASLKLPFAVSNVAVSRFFVP